MPVVDLAFRLVGEAIPADHGYLLYSALSREAPLLHSAGDKGAGAAGELGVHPINGRLSGERRLALTPSSRLTIRLDIALLAQLLPLVGKTLTLGGTKLQVGVPEVRVLVPAARLRSRLVTIKNAVEPDTFLEATRKKLAELKVQGEPGLLRRQGAKALEGRSGISPDRCPFIRRTLRIKDKEVVGYALEVRGLDAEDSIRLQETGLGGRRRFGCGVFVGARE